MVLLKKCKELQELMVDSLGIFILWLPGKKSKDSNNLIGREQKFVLWTFMLAPRTWKAMESNCIPHVFHGGKGSYCFHMKITWKWCLGT
jgi:hypothetical protein